MFKTLLLRGAPSPVTAREEGLQGDVKFAFSKKRNSSTGRSFHANGPTTE